MISRTLLIASLCTLVLGAPTAYNLQLHEPRTEITACFSLTGPSPPDTPPQLRIALVQPNSPALEEKFYALSTPSGANYGTHLSKKEVDQLLNSSSDSYSRDSVLIWVDVANAANHYADAKGAALLNSYIAASASVNNFNEIPDANVSVFKRDESGPHSIRTLSYSIPAESEGHLDSVHPTISFPNPIPHAISIGDDSLDGSLDPLSLLLKARAPPQVLTLSNSQNADTLSPKLAAMYALLTARGTSLIVSSGNGGVSHSRSARASPNVATHGADCALVVDGKMARVDNAGAALAVVTAVVAPLNDRLIAAGRGPLELEFLNLVLYHSAAGAAAFTDVTAGSIPG